MSCGSSRAAFAIAACTSCAAPSMSRSRLNCIVIWVDPSALVDDMESMPAMVENCFSRGVATAEAMVSGLAPGRLADTLIVGKSTFGRSLTGRRPYPAMPKITTATMMSDVMTGLRMKSSDMLIARCLQAFLDFYNCTGGELHLPVRNYCLTRLHALFDDRQTFLRQAGFHRP